MLIDGARTRTLSPTHRFIHAPFCCVVKRKDMGDDSRSPSHARSYTSATSLLTLSSELTNVSSNPDPASERTGGDPSPETPESSWKLRAQIMKGDMDCEVIADMNSKYARNDVEGLLRLRWPLKVVKFN